MQNKKESNDLGARYNTSIDSMHVKDKVAEVPKQEISYTMTYPCEKSFILRK